MAYIAPYVDEAGLHVPTYVDIRDSLIASYKEIYGEDLYLGNDSQDYQMISIHASMIADTMSLLQLVWNNHSPKTAVGTALSALVKLNGIARKVASYSTCVLTLTGKAGTIIKGGTVKDESGYIWSLPDTVTLTGHTTDITAECQTLGAVEATIGTINKINTPQAGWTAVTNNVAAVVGAPVETDAELRGRQSVSVAIPSQNMLESTVAAIKAIPEVSRSRVYDNDTSVTDEHGIPSHSIAAVVEGGLDADIAEAIYMRKGPGGGTYGSTTYDYTNEVGVTTAIQYSRPTYATVDVALAVRKGFRYTTDYLGWLKTAIEAYIESLSIGYPVTVTGILKAVSTVVEDPTNPPFLIAGLQLGVAGESMGTTDLPIELNAVAEVGTVTVSEVT